MPGQPLGEEGTVPYSSVVGVRIKERKKERNSGEERNTASTQDGSHGENSYLNQLANIHLIERGVDSSFR